MYMSLPRITQDMKAEVT